MELKTKIGGTEYNITDKTQSKKIWIAIDNNDIQQYHIIGAFETKQKALEAIIKYFCKSTGAEKAYIGCIGKDCALVLDYEEEYIAEYDIAEVEVA